MSHVEESPTLYDEALALVRDRRTTRASHAQRLLAWRDTFRELTKGSGKEWDVRERNAAVRRAARFRQRTIPPAPTAPQLYREAIRAARYSRTVIPAHLPCGEDDYAWEQREHARHMAHVLLEAAMYVDIDEWRVMRIGDI